MLKNPAKNPASDVTSPKLPSSDRFHPAIYLLVAGLVAVFVISAFDFGDRGYVDYLLVVVSGFFVIAMGIPLLLWLTWLHQTPAHDRAGSLRDWSRRDYETWQGPLKGREAALQILLPIGAVAVGMAAIGIVMLLVEHHVV
ncbi:hypothetical protein [Pseudorhodoplanes sp.]|uniref:hypothetical protein n=1 Tax=Pseudorhodoplanes sp. TaxID=1934341 RepID=UPI002BCA4EBD|nr:hypothetical protein [Pseudorhodoplanes sp.]HWV52367.1 hypothetical protein [Pseudorhodoplanes sp.]